MVRQINNWLENPKRSYAFGLSIFLALASSEIKKRYSDFFKEVDPETVNPSDIRFPMLINKVTAIYNNVRTNPEKYAEALASLSGPGKPIVKTAEGVQQIISLRNHANELQTQIDELEGADEDKSTEIEDLKEQVNKQDEQILALKAKLKESGLRVLEETDLPKSISEKYTRVKDIVPLMASLHGDLRNESLSDEQRKGIAEELCRLDDERRAIWDNINNYLKDYDSAFTKKDEVEYSDDPVIRGVQIANRMKRLKENATRSLEAAEKHKATQKTELEEKARNRAKEYQEEYDKLQAMVNEAK